MPVNQWMYHVDIRDIWKAPDLSLEKQRDLIVARLQSSKWYLDSIAEDPNCDLMYAVDELGETNEEDWFNWVWDTIYDIADADRCWINIF